MPLADRTRRAAEPVAPPAPDGRSPATPVLLTDAVPLFLAHLEARGYARHSVEAARLDLGQLGRYLGRQPLASVSTDDLRAFFAWLRRQHGNRPASLRRKTSSVKRFFAFVHAAEPVAGDPAAALAYPPLAATPTRPLTAEEAAAVPAGAGDPAWQALVLALLDCGLKRDEAVALRWEDVELEPPPGRLHVRHRAESRRTRRRTLGVSERLAAALHTLARQRTADGTAADGRVFDLSARGVDFVIATCAQRAGVRPGETVTPQQLRDAYACGRVTARLAVEVVLADPEARLRVRREHDVLLLRELGLADSSAAPARYRRLVAERTTTDT